jgi:N-acetyl sugar amidotransferase
MRRCTRCLLPETHETIVYDAGGTCNICTQRDFRDERVDFRERKRELDTLIESYRGKHDYDCIVPFSGGKDSTFTLYYLVKEYGLKPLVVRFDHGFLRPGVESNTAKVVSQLGVAFHQFTPEWSVVRRLMLQALLDKGDFCWHCHTGIFAYPMWVAVRQQVPLVVWGEPSAEYTAYYGYDQQEEVDETRFNRFVNLGITAEDMAVRVGGDLDDRDLKPFAYPPLQELRRIGYRSICLGSYIPWDPKKQAEVIERELGWQRDEVENVPPAYGYEKIECFVQGVRDYLKYLKRGYSRPTHLAALDLRAGRLSRGEAERMIAEYEGRRPPSLDLFLRFLGLTEQEFLEIAASHSVSPHQPDPAAIRPGRRTHDYDRWPCKAGLPREQAERQLERWRRRKHLPLRVETAQ